MIEKTRRESAEPPQTRLTDGHALTIGMFDGVHLGHRAVLSRTREAAAARGLLTAAVTFVPHPRSVLYPGQEVKYLTSLEERVERLRGEGMEDVLVLDFDRALAQLTARQFFERVAGRLTVRHLVLGEGFRLGRGREAGVEELQRLGRELGWTVEGVPPVVLEGEPVSSTRIREALLSGGDVELAARLLGRPYSLSGPVVQGFGRGRTIGVPTANVRVADDLLAPRDGVYLCTAHIASEPSVAPVGVLNIGTRPTFGAGVRSVEAHLLDWSGDLYGRSVRLDLLRRLRDERRFEGVEALIAQIHSDIAQARALAERERAAPG